MRIAQVSPLYESVPPKTYGGTERVVHYLTEELVRLGHEVTLYAAGDSTTTARLVAPCPRSLRLDKDCIDCIAHHVLLLDLLIEDRNSYDVFHFPLDYFHFPLSRALGLPQLTTLHGRLDLPDLQALYDRFPEMQVVSISNAQRTPLPQANWIGTVPHGLPSRLLRFNEHPQDYFAFIGRISPEKRVDRAIEIAIALDRPLKIAAKVDKADEEYFNEHIAALLEHPLVEYLGEIGDAEKSDFLGNARAVLFPIDWPEPFGLVMIEAMACGTPVVAYRAGSVPEILEHGVTGFIVDDIETAIRQASRVDILNRKLIRQQFERRFSAERMAADYVRLYQRLVMPPKKRVEHAA
jgi:glycosyltransferase involved in cell wall biosynthesis